MTISSSHIMPEIQNLGKLRLLDLSNNLIERVQPEVGSIASLFALKLLDNSLSALPIEITQLGLMIMLDLRRVNLNCDFNAHQSAKIMRRLGTMSEQGRAAVLGATGQADEITDFASLNEVLAVEA